MVHFNLTVFPPFEPMKGYSLKDIMTDEMRRVIILLETEKTDAPFPETDPNDSPC